MPYKVPQSKVKARMVKEAAAKHSQLMQLQQEHDRLKHQHDVLMQCCDLLQWMRLQQLSTDADCVETDCTIDIGSDSSCGSYCIDEHELQLLQQLHCLPHSVAGSAAADGTETSAETPLSESSHQCSNSFNNSSTSSSTSAQITAGLPLQYSTATAITAAAADQQCSNLNPPDDATQFFRTLISQPPHPRAQTMTLQELLDDYSALICELSLNLVALQSSDLHCNTQEHPLEAIHRLIIRHFHVIVSTALHRADLVMAFYASNCATRRLHDDSLQNHVCRALQQLQLSPQQQQQISDRITVFKRLLIPLVQARQQLQCNGFRSAAAAAGSRAVTAAADADAPRPAAAVDGRAVTAATGASAPAPPAAVAAAAAPAALVRSVQSTCVTAAECKTAAAAAAADDCSSEDSSADIDQSDQSEGSLLRRSSLQQQQQKVTDLQTLMKKVSFSACGIEPSPRQVIWLAPPLLQALHSGCLVPIWSTAASRCGVLACVIMHRDYQTQPAVRWKINCAKRRCPQSSACFVLAGIRTTLNPRMTWVLIRY